MKLDNRDVDSLMALMDAVRACPENTPEWYQTVANSLENEWLSEQLLDYVPKIAGMDNAGRIDSTKEFIRILRTN